MVIYGIHHMQELPNEIIEQIDEHISQAFQLVFRVRELPQRIPLENLAELAELEKHDMALASLLSQYEISSDDNNYWQARITSSFSIFTTGMPVREFSLETIGYSSNEQLALQQAVEKLPAQLEYHVNSLSEMGRVILEKFDNRIVLAFGRDTGVQVGHEYEVRRLVESTGEESVWESIALLRVREVGENYSITDIILENQPLLLTDQVLKLPRLGPGLAPYTSLAFASPPNALSHLSVGLKTGLDLGVYVFQPLIGLEFTFPLIAGVNSLLVSVNVGAGYNIFLDRFRLMPQAFFGVVGDISDSGFMIAALQSRIVLRLSYLLPTVHSNVELYLEGGFTLRFGLAGYENSQIVSLGLGANIR